MLSANTTITWPRYKSQHNSQTRELMVQSAINHGYITSTFRYFQLWRVIGVLLIGSFPGVSLMNKFANHFQLFNRGSHLSDT